MCLFTQRSFQSGRLQYIFIYVFSIHQNTHSHSKQYFDFICLFFFFMLVELLSIGVHTSTHTCTRARAIQTVHIIGFYIPSFSSFGKMKIYLHGNWHQMPHTYSHWMCVCVFIVNNSPCAHFRTHTGIRRVHLHIYFDGECLLKSKTY